MKNVKRVFLGRKAAAVTPAVMVVAFAGSLCAPAVAPVGADEASAAQPGRWIGTTQGTAQRASRWVSGGSTQKGDFWFTVDRRGRVEGQAVVAYTPTFDATGLNALVGYARGLTQAAVGAVPLVGRARRRAAQRLHRRGHSVRGATGNQACPDHRHAQGGQALAALGP